MGGLKFDSNKDLWAFDSQNCSAIKVNASGNQVDQSNFGDRSFSNVNFLSNGEILLGEHLTGDESNNKALEGPRKLGTVLPFMPGTERYGDGNIHKFSKDGEPIETYETETNGGMPGFLGVTASALAPDESKIIYISELGNCIFQFDIVNNKQMNDLITYEPDSGNMVIAIGFSNTGDFYSIKANFREGFSLCRHDVESGSILDEKMLPGPGWATLCLCEDGMHAILGNFFNGQIAKIDLASGQMIASAETEVERSVAGIAEF
ncbi:MAG: hypothetical protein CMD96_03355 [Gammaproteobacteria bacterium]|nr:hypothetical protein [Gammaproteobacteria bacterium]